MANYCGFTRTNYFRVTDAERLKKIIGSARLGEDTLELFERKTDDEVYYGFGCYDSIEGLCPNWERADEYDEPEDDEPSFELFEAELRKILHPSDAIVITEVGYEKLRYLTAYSCIITVNGFATVSLKDASIQKTQELLCNPRWDTVMEY